MPSLFRATLMASVMMTLAASLLGLSAGEVAPEFSAKNQDGKVIKLSDFRGKPVLLFFYPKDDTPGCTKEACKFRDEYSRLKKLDTVVLGISRQDEKSHQEFKTKHKLPYDLLVDESGSIAESFGVGKMPIIGLLKRKSVLIGADGKVIRYYDEVNPETHADEVIRDLEKEKAKSAK